MVKKLLKHRCSIQVYTKQRSSYYKSNNLKRSVQGIDEIKLVFMMIKRSKYSCNLYMRHGSLH